jgi:hypothetical protein
MCGERECAQLPRSFETQGEGNKEEAMNPGHWKKDKTDRCVVKHRRICNIHLAEQPENGPREAGQTVESARDENVPITKPNC